MKSYNHKCINNEQKNNYNCIVYKNEHNYYIYNTTNGR